MFGQREGLWVDIEGCVCLWGRGDRPWRQTWKVMSSQVGFMACCNSWTPDRMDEKSRQRQLLARGLRYVKSQSSPEWWRRPLPLSLPSRQRHWCGYDFLSTLNLSELLFFKQITCEGIHLGYFQTPTLRKRKRVRVREGGHSSWFCNQNTGFCFTRGYKQKKVHKVNCLSQWTVNVTYCYKKSCCFLVATNRHSLFAFEYRTRISCLV